jgi:hypothetical protein
MSIFYTLSVGYAFFVMLAQKRFLYSTHVALVQVPEGPPGTEQASLSPDHHCQGREKPVGGVHGHRRQGTQRTVPFAYEEIKMLRIG